MRKEEYNWSYSCKSFLSF